MQSKSRSIFMDKNCETIIQVYLSLISTMDDNTFNNYIEPIIPATKKGRNSSCLQTRVPGPQTTWKKRFPLPGLLQYIPLRFRNKLLVLALCDLIIPLKGKIKSD